MERDKFNELIILFTWMAVFGLKFIFTLWPQTSELERLFPFNPQLITRPTYMDYFADCWTYILLSFMMLLIMPKYREQLFYVTVLWVGYFIEYYMMYNQPIFHIFGLPVGYSLFAAMIFAGLVLRSAIKLYI